MNANEFSDALGEINGSYVAEAVTYRKRGRWIPWASVAACLILVLNLLIPTPINEIPTPTGGAQAYYADGVPLSLPKMGDSELIVEDVQISMDIQTLDQNGSEGIGSAVIETTLKNPTQEVVTVPVTLPCGNAPRYLYTYDQNGNSFLSYPIFDLCEITLDGIPIAATVQLTAKNTAPNPENQKITTRISLDSPVTKYTYRITELEESDNPRITLWGAGKGKNYIALVETEYGYYLVHSDDEVYIPISYHLPTEGDTITLYVIGDHDDFAPTWHIKAWDTKQIIPNTIAFESTETMTFLDFAGQSWKPEFQISKENWAVSVAAELDPHPLISVRFVEFGTLSIYAYHWLTYELTLEPGQTATHRIELPLYPDYFGGGSRTYHINLNSLLTLFPTGNQNLTLITPFMMDQTSVQWEQNETTYHVDLSDVNDLDLDFRLVMPLSTEPVDPDMSVIPSRDWITWICIAVLIVLFLLARKYRREDRK